MRRFAAFLLARLLVAVLVVLAGGGRAWAVVPNITGVSVANPYTPANTMMYNVTVTVSGAYNDADHDAHVGFAATGTDCATGTWKFSHTERFATVTSKTWTLYNFQPGTAYDYKVEVGHGASAKTQCGNLGTPSLPANLGYLALAQTETAGSFSTKYVMLDTDDCGAGGAGARQYLLVWDTATEKVVWYLDVQAVASLGGTTLDGWRVQLGVSPPGTMHVVAIADRRYLYDWSMSGAALDSKDYGTACTGAGGSSGPCASHDVFKSLDTGHTYVAMSQVSGTAIGGGTDWDGFAACGPPPPATDHDSRFVDDGYQQFDGAYSTLSADNFLMTDYSYSPSADSGPETGSAGQCNSNYWAPYFDPAHGPIDWTHINSVSASKPGSDELLLLSLYGWDQVVRVNAATGAKLWTLSGKTGYSSLTLAKDAGISGPTDFTHQHNVYEQDGYVQMFDNEGDSTQSRVLRLALSGGPPVTTATIVKSWPVVDSAGTAQVCQGRGDGVTVAGTSGNNVLAMCSNSYLVAELNDSDGSTAAAPPLTLSLPSTGFCSTGGPGTRSGIKGWYRAFPMVSVGEF